MKSVEFTGTFVPSTRFNIYIIRHDPLFLSISVYLLLSVLVGYFISLFGMLLPIVCVGFLSSTVYSDYRETQPIEYQMTTHAFFVLLEALLFAAYFWYFFHHDLDDEFDSESQLAGSTMAFLGSSLLSITTLGGNIMGLGLFLVATFFEYYSEMDTLYLNDELIDAMLITIVSLHALHLIVAHIFSYLGFPYLPYFRLIEAVWIFIGLIDNID